MSTRVMVGVLGATGAVGQRLVALLDGHPRFQLADLAASPKRAGQAYGEAVAWRLPGGLPARAADLVLRDLSEGPLEGVTTYFSALDSSVAGELEEAFAASGRAVVSNSRNHRLDPEVPLLIPEVNLNHLEAIGRQRKRRGGPGFIVTNPNCSVVHVAMTLAPLDRAFGVERVHVTTLQAASGAGYPGVSAWDLIDNVIPYIGGGEEEKIEAEPRKILGRHDAAGFTPSAMQISAAVNRVGVLDGHLATLSVAFRERATIPQVQEALRDFRGPDLLRGLPSAPDPPIHVLDEPDRPQPRLDRDRGRGMAVSVGRIRPCPIADVRLVALSHNLVRGAAGAALLNAEVLAADGWLP